jgi:hypothetical protein
LAQKINILKKPFVLLCEGKHDSEFFEHLIASRNIPADFEVCSVSYALGTSSATGGGNTRYTEALDALVVLPGFDKVTTILLVVDCDVNHTVEFSRVVDAINATAPIFGPPASRFVAPSSPGVKAGVSPGLVVMMMPPNGPIGSLSSMCWAAARNATPLAPCIDALATCTGADRWSESKLAKMRLHSLIASTHERKPNLGPAYVWSENTNLVPLSDPVFDDVETFLRNFSTL